MNLGTWLEVAIGLAALYFLLATACSTGLEWIHSVGGVRGRALTMFLEEMLTGERAGERANPDTSPPDLLSRVVGWVTAILRIGSWLIRWMSGYASPAARNPGADWLLEHPLLKSLHKPSSFLSDADTPPSYIPSQVISQTMLSALVQKFGPLCIELASARPWLARLAPPAPVQEALDRLLNASQPTNASLWPVLKVLLPQGVKQAVAPADLLAAAAALKNWLPARPDGTPLAVVLFHVEAALNALAASGTTYGTPDQALDALVKEVGRRLPVTEMSFEVLRSIVNSGALSPALQQSLQSILDAADFDLDKVRTGIERWYDSVMDRATGWFKRRSMAALFWMGLVAAAGLNLDSFDIARQLLEKPALRQRAATLGETLTKTAPERLAVLTQQTVFVEWVLKERLIQGEGEVTQEQTLKALSLLLRSPENVGPVLSLAQQPEGPDAESLKKRIAITACRGRLNRTPRELASENLRKLAALNDEALLQDDYCKLEREAAAESLQARIAVTVCRARLNKVPPESASGNPSKLTTLSDYALLKDDYCKPEREATADSLKSRFAATVCRARLNKDPRESASENLLKLTALNDDDLLKNEYCKQDREAIAKSPPGLIALSSVSWNVEAAGASWEAATKPPEPANQTAPQTDEAKNAAVEAKRTADRLEWMKLRAIYKQAIAGTEQLVEDVRAAYNLLDNVGPLWNTWGSLWCDPKRASASGSRSKPDSSQGAASAASASRAASDPKADNPATQGSAPAAHTSAPASAASPSATPASAAPVATSTCKAPDLDGVKMLVSLVGWLITALMVSFGAPFWFDLLNKLVNRRASGPKTAEG